jgi:hypothetical protein
MKKLILICLLRGACSASFAQAPNPAKLKEPIQTKRDSQVYDVTLNGIEMTVQYIDPRQCAVEFMKEAEAKQWSREKQAEEAAKVPSGGYLACAWARSSAPLASADNFTFVVEAPDGREIRRWKPESTIAQPVVLGTKTLYTDVAMVRLPEPLTDGVRVFVLEEPAHKRFEFIIHP